MALYGEVHKTRELKLNMEAPLTAVDNFRLPRRQSGWAEPCRLAYRVKDPAQLSLPRTARPLKGAPCSRTKK